MDPLEKQIMDTQSLLLKLKKQRELMKKPGNPNTVKESPVVEPQTQSENTEIEKEIQVQQGNNGHSKLNELERPSFSPQQQMGLGFTSSLREMTQEIRSNNLKETLFHSENIEMKTRLNGESVALIAISRMVAAKYDIPELMGFCDDLMQLRVSLRGEGRKEGVQMEQGQSFMGPGGPPRM